MSGNSILSVFSVRGLLELINHLMKYYKNNLAIAIVGTPHKHVTLCLISTSMARLCSRQFALYVYT